MHGRKRIFIVGAIAAALAASSAGHGVAEDRWVIEPAPEASGAAAAGAADVKRAQSLAKAKQYTEAVTVLEQVARRWPAAIHDCNLALAYLRAGALTRARLVWDLSALRGGSRPKWCTSDVATQISNAVRAAGFVAVILDVTPADAVIEVGGVAMRRMTTVWLPAGPMTIGASAAGRQSQTITASVVGPNARVAVALELPPPVPLAEPDAGVTAVQPPADATAESFGPAAVDPPEVAPEPAPPLVLGGSPVSWRAVALGAAIAGWVGAGVFGYLAYDARGDANALYPTDPAFDDAKSRYGNARDVTLGLAVVGLVGTVASIYFLATGGDKPAQPRRVEVGGNFRDGFGISYSGTFGGGR